MKKRILIAATFILIALFFTNTSSLKKVHAQNFPTPIVLVVALSTPMYSIY
jgi:hypothetical protein